jgi:hypothetical protein
MSDERAAILSCVGYYRRRRGCFGPHRASCGQPRRADTPLSKRRSSGLLADDSASRSTERSSVCHDPGVERSSRWNGVMERGGPIAA